ncbi:MAG: hypothetical protein ACJAS4_002467 [Bacteriovoracaceae bacterium]|jgi:hypothetical protein
MRIFVSLLILVFLTSCSLAPFSPTSSGRSYGQGKFRSEVGNSNSSYHLKFGLGVTKDLDAGFLMEFGEISTSALFLKYSFLNNEVGPSMAAEFGYGSTELTKFYYGGIATSLAFSKEFELFANGRINSVSTDETDIEKDKFHGNIMITDYEVTYIQGTVGFNVWFSESAGISLYTTYYKGSNIETNKDSVFGGSFLFNY